MVILKNVVKQLILQ